VLTPHIGWVAEGSYALFIADVAKNITAYLDGQPAPNPINPDALTRARARLSG
jgi:phosphoglycerate dehydrogenase-like enzyme